MTFDPRSLAANDAARLRGYADAERWYNGEHWPPGARRTTRQLTLNYIKLIVQKTVAYTVGGLGSVCDPAEEGDPAREQARNVEQTVARIRRAAAFDATVLRAELNAAVYGDAAYKVTWDADAHRIQIAAPQPSRLFPRFAWEDPAQLFEMHHQYPMTRTGARALFGRDATPSGSGSVTVTEHWTADKYIAFVGAQQVTKTPNPYGVVPFVWLPNTPKLGSPFGESDVEQIRTPNEELNRAVTQISRILELSGNPIAVLEGVSGAQNIAVQPGALWELPQDSRAYLLDLLRDGGARLHLEMIDRLRLFMQDLSENPAASFGEGGERPSGAALALELDPLTKRVERKRTLRSAVYERLDEIVLSIHKEYADHTLDPLPTRTVWGPVLPTDRTALVLDEIQLVAAGVHSRRHAANLTGVTDPDAEFAQLLDEETSLQEAKGQNTPAPEGEV